MPLKSVNQPLLYKFIFWSYVQPVQSFPSLKLVVLPKLKSWDWPTIYQPLSIHDFLKGIKVNCIFFKDLNSGHHVHFQLQ